MVFVVPNVGQQISMKYRRKKVGINPKKLRVKKDIVIKAGTILECIDGRTSKYHSGNYAVSLGLTKDTAGEFIYGWDSLCEGIPEWLEEVNE
jgi:hypothetical protein